MSGLRYFWKDIVHKTQTCARARLLITKQKNTAQSPGSCYLCIELATLISKKSLQSSFDQELVLQEGQAGTFKRKREGKDPEVEEALDQWFSIVSGKGVNINGPILKAKSEELDKKRRRNDFKATDNNIKFKKAQYEKGSSDNESAEQWKTTKAPTFLDNFGADDI
ncbi:hypothetical protein RF11_13254 [Thelohanellus kitauei]|uniref:HTH CENPB-type domain-containing protein n=1 Tax=Thelohanellus kitauei TaxID=669202 RepID=A0A0C2MF99_THEKT|nr:hypothetical protein RF11_13254 [Thelohanellus kitauei]